MFAKLNTILIVGATGGLGEAFARQFHALGKKVIITGRRAERLSALKSELPGLETYQWDISDISAIPKHVATLLKAHPDTDAVFLNGGRMESFFWADPSMSTPESVANEVTVNLTAPMVMMREFVPYLVAKAKEGKPAALLVTTSGMAYMCRPLYPIYPGTKAAIHLNLVALRQQIGLQPDIVKKNFSVCEVAPPYVDTDLDTRFRDRNIAFQGGREKAVPPMALKTYIDTTMAQLRGTPADGKLPKELTTGFSEMVNNAWRGAFDELVADSY